MSTKVTKAQLQDEVERLRAHVDHLETMNAALNEQVASLRNESLGNNDEAMDQLRRDLHESELNGCAMGRLIEHWAGLQDASYINLDFTQFMRLARAGFEQREQIADEHPAPVRHVPRTDRPLRRVFEFNPNVPGDYHRALLLAKQHNGVARRAAQ